MHKHSDSYLEHVYLIFYQQHAKIFQWFFKQTHSIAIAEDLAQDVYLHLWKKKGDLVLIKDRASFLRRMARNELIKYYQKRSHQIKHLSLLRCQKTYENATDELLEHRLHDRLIFECILQLSPQRRKVFVLGKLEGRKHSEIARWLGISAFTVRNTMQNALKELREYLAKHGEIGCTADAPKRSGATCINIPQHELFEYSDTILKADNS